MYPKDKFFIVVWITGVVITMAIFIGIWKGLNIPREPIVYTIKVMEI